MLPRQNRLPLKTPFIPEFQKRTDLFTVKCRKNKDNTNRYAFVVGKRVDKSAVVRNRTKRVFRQCISELEPSFMTGYDMLFIVRKPCAKEQKEILCKTIRSALGLR